MSVMEVKVPDIGDFKDVPIIEIAVKPGDVVKTDDPLITLESDKATMEVPAPSEGKVVQVLVNIGDKVSEGTAIVKLEAGEQAVSAPSVLAQQEPDLDIKASTKKNGKSDAASAASAAGLPPPGALDFGGVHASPGVRRLARELAIDLTQVKGTGDKGRITKDDVKAALRTSGQPAASGGMGIPEIPPQDFSKFGPVETKVLSRIRKLSGPFLHRSWLNVPHVTHTDEADITELEPYRKTLDAAAKEKGFRVTMLAFLMKASTVALKEHPEFNSSLSPAKDSLVLKKYYHLGVAVDTPDGLVVPVIQNVDRKGILELSQELGAVSKKMREGKIAPSDIQGASFTISSLGGIGGTNFTPIVNAPEVAILGVVRSTMKPVWDGKAFQPRLMLPLCVSYDHRVIDGALAARFTRRLGSILEDVRQLVL
jgi:pyruvate dehydrogenase E2 component (dihydrolipoyllysine-residue acetyltransferase)